MKKSLLVVSAISSAFNYGQAQFSSALSKLSKEKKCEIVFAKNEFDSFSEAKAAASNRFKDGEQIWMYVKFQNNLSELLKLQDGERSRDGVVTKTGSLKFEVETEGGDRFSGSDDALLNLKGDQLNINEMKVWLTPEGLKGMKTKYVFRGLLKMVTTGDAGTWKNKIIITDDNRHNFINGREIEGILGSSEITCDVANGFPLYLKSYEGYQSLLDKGSVEINDLPKSGKYTGDQKLITNVLLQFEQKYSVRPSKVYFTADEWNSGIYRPNNIDRYRRIPVVIVYKKKSSCFYKTGHLYQDYIPSTGTYSSETEMGLYGSDDQEGHPISCDKIK